MGELNHGRFSAKMVSGSVFPWIWPQGKRRTQPLCLVSGGSEWGRPGNLRVLAVERGWSWVDVGVP